MSVFFADLKYGFRMLVKHPGLASIAIIALALGIGLTTTMWSITWGGILRGLPFEKSAQLMHLERARPDKGQESIEVPQSDFAAWRERQKSFEDLAAFREGTVNVSGTEGKPERFEGAFLTASTFRLLRVQPVKGRLFRDEDNQPGAPPVALLGWDLWQSRFGGDEVIGRTLRANGVTREIIGIMPRGFMFPTNAGIWLPEEINPLARPWGEGEGYEIMGRLRDGVTLALAKEEFAGITRQIGVEHPKENEGMNAVIKPFTDEYIGEEPVLMLWTMMAAVFGVLLIACSNVANLLLARAVTRTKEVAVRTALGASRWRIVSQLLTESLVLSSIGALLGTGMAWVGSRWFMEQLRPTEPPFWIDIHLDGAVLGFAAGIAVLSALVSGVLPALQATGGNIQEVLKDESRGASSLRIGRFSRGLVIAELALAGGLLVAAGFMIESVWTLTRFNYGVETASTFTARLGLFESTYPDSASRLRFWQALEERLHAMPGQSGVGLSTALPGLWGNWVNFGLEGKSYAKEQDFPSTRFVAVSPGWFEAFKLQPVEGRVLGPGDVGGSLPVAVVTQRFVQEHLGPGSALGKRIRIGNLETKEPWLTIVGVIPDVWFDGNETDNPQRTAVLAPILQGDYRFLSIAVASRGDPMALARPVQQVVSGLDPDQPIYFTRTLKDAISRSAWFYEVFGTLFVAFGGAALFLATVGVYGVMSFSVSRRTREIGVRMALGASGRDVVGMFLRQGGLQALIGLSAGAVLAVFLAKGLRIVLFQVNTANWLMYAGVSLALGLTSLLATWIPARRAVAVDPNVALRYD
ncbi:MAG: ABC transporter permease [Gemmatimonadales bacterium]